MSELIDLVNARGEIVWQGISRNDAESYENAYMQIVIAVIFNSLGHVLAHERAAIKQVAGGAIDHVCGGMLSGETPEIAALREAREEVGVMPTDLRIIRQGINEYGRYCYLLVGNSDDDPGAELDPNEVAWAAYHEVDNLLEASKLGTMKFVEGFFEDIVHAQQNRR